MSLSNYKFFSLLRWLTLKQEKGNSNPTSKFVLLTSISNRYSWGYTVKDRESSKWNVTVGNPSSTLHEEYKSQMRNFQKLSEKKKKKEESPDSEHYTDINKNIPVLIRARMFSLSKGHYAISYTKANSHG